MSTGLVWNRKDNAVTSTYDSWADAQRSTIDRTVTCSNCGSPVVSHCRVHLVPCCPGKCVRERAREALALCMADVEDSPGPTAYAVADDLLLALDNAGISLANSAAASQNRKDTT